MPYYSGLIGLSLGLTVGISLHADPPRTDSLGDPLPPGAVARLGTMRLAHGKKLAAVAFAPDGKSFATAAADGPVHLWDVATGKELRQFHVEEYQFFSLAFSQDGQSLAAGGVRPTGVGCLALWPVVGAQKPRILAEVRKPDALAFVNNDQSVVTVGNDGKAHSFEVKTGKELGVLDLLEKAKATTLAKGRAAGEVGQPQISRDGKLLVVSLPWRWLAPNEAKGTETYLHAFDLETGKELWHQGPSFFPAYFVLAAAGNRLLVQQDGADELVWLDARTGKEGGRLPAEELPQGTMTLDPTGKMAVVGVKDDGIFVWDLDKNKASKRIPLPPTEAWAGQGIQALCVSPDRATLFAAFNLRGRLFDLNTGKERLALAGHCTPVTQIQFTPDGSLLASHSELPGLGGQAAFRWNASTSKEVERYHVDALSNSDLLSPDGRLALQRQAEGELVVIERATSRKVGRLDVPARNEVASCYFSADGRLVIVPEEKAKGTPAVFVLDATTGKKRGRVELGDGASRSPFQVSPDGAWLAWGQFDGTISVAEVATGKVRWQLGQRPEDRVFNAGTPLSFSPDGRHLAARGGPDADIRLWDLRMGSEAGRMPAEDKEERPALVSWSLHGRTLALSRATSKPALEIWEVATGQRRRVIALPTKVHSLAFAPSGRLVATGNEDGAVLLWDLHAQAAAGTTPKPNLTPGELKAYWAALGEPDAVKAGDALTALIAAPGESIPFLREQLQPIKESESKRVTQLVDDLNSSSFAVRDKATRALGELAGLAEPALEKALADNPPEELRRRGEALLKSLQSHGKTSPGLLRAWRAMEALEVLGTPEARSVLERLAQGAAAARVTQEARASLERLKQLKR